MAEKISLFKARNRQNSVNTISIDFGKASVSGYLLEPISVGADAKYDTFFNFDGKLGLIGEILGFVGGIQIGKAGFWTRQYYKGGSYIKIDGKMRVVNWGTTIEYALDAMETMISRCMPTSSVLEETAKSNLIGAGQTAKRIFTDRFPGEEQDPKDKFIEEKNKKETDSLVSSLISKGVKAIDDLVEGSPETATITTNFMRLDNMVLTNVECTPSKEILTTIGNTKNAPLYVDINFSFVQKEIKTKGEVQTMIGRNKPIVRVQ